MKKRTLGRIAAVGLAGLTAVPAMAMVASADVSVYTDGNLYEGRESYISGTAAYIEWDLVQYTTTLNADEWLNNDGTINIAKRTGNVDWGWAQDFTNPTLYRQLKPKNQEYWLKSADATKRISEIDAEISEYTNKATSDERTWMAQLNDYINLVKNTASATTVTPPAYRKLPDGTFENTSRVVKTYVDNDKNTWTWTLYANGDLEIKRGIALQNTFNIANAAQMDFAGMFNNYKPGRLTMTKIDYRTTKPVVQNITMLELRTRLNKSTVSIAGGQIVTGVDYYIHTDSPTSSTGTGTGTGTGNTGTNTGSTGTYAIPSAYRYASSVSYYSNVTGLWYPNMASLNAAAGTGTSYTTKTPTYPYSSAYCYFDPITGNYVTASQVTSGAYPYAVYVSANSDVTTNTENAIYRVNGLYYYTWSSAYAAAGYNAALVTYVTSYSSLGNYFSRYTGGFYSTYAAALAASANNSSYVVTLNGVAGGGYDYTDPYYLYFMNMGGSSNNNNNSSNSLGGASVKIGNKSGWSNVRSQINKASSGSTLDVSLNGEVIIPQEVLSALAGKNVNVNFKLSNGAIVSYNGQDISGAQNVNVAVQYNTNNVPSGLVKKATSVNNSLSTSQISLAGATLAGDASVTVKYSTKRAGCTAKIYRYNESRNSLQLVDKSTVGSNGKVTFDGMKQGGDFVIVLFEAE